MALQHNPFATKKAVNAPTATGAVAPRHLWPAGENREQNGSKEGATPLSSQDLLKSGANREQAAVAYADSFLGTKIDIEPRSNDSLKGEQIESKAGANREQVGLQPGAKREQTRSEAGANRERTGSESEANRGRIESKEGAQSGAVPGAKREQLTPLFSQFIGLQRAILVYTHDLCIKERAAKTPPIFNKEVAGLLATTEDTVKNAFKRLCAANGLVRGRYKAGRGGWSTYSLPSSLHEQILEAKERGQIGSKQGASSGAKPGAAPHVVSSSDQTDPTTTDKELLERFQEACSRFGLSQLRIDANDVMTAWRKGAYGSVDDLLISIEHMAFYLNSTDSKGIEDPKVFFRSKITKGFFAAPAGFQSWEEIQTEIKLRDAEERLARLRELKRKKLDVDFELWFAELSSTDRERLFREHFPSTPLMTGTGAKSALRDIFNQQSDT